MRIQKKYSEKERVRKISKMIRYAGERLTRKFSILNFQNQIGLFIFLFSILGIIIVSTLYSKSILTTIPTILLNAFFASLLHELEHDLIHSLYFKDTWIEKMMMWGVWIFKANTTSPFYRKKIHLLHHRESGQLTDIEEQMIGNGMKLGFKRFITMIDQNTAFFMNSSNVAKTAPELNRFEMFKSAFPIFAIFTSLFQAFLFLNLFVFLNQILNLQILIPELITQSLKYLNFFGVIYLVPNFIRQFALQLVSSNMHYFGDINSGRESVLEQTQVLDSWIFFPLHFFCFNFGSTHGIHHFVVNQPFYLRQMISPLAHASMKRYGVRFNDFGSFIRANRFNKTKIA